VRNLRGEHRPIPQQRPALSGRARLVKDAMPRGAHGRTRTLQDMSRIDQEARSLLLHRRERLSRHLFEAQPADPSARWRDWETVNGPLPEPVRRELADIDQALRRIEEGRYGICQACGGPMGMQRIRAIPEARYCVSCSGTRSAAD
jgi:RNA polymerase-binding transcription factor DksA